MKFTVVAVASFIGAAVAAANPGDATIYSTQVVTVTSCPPEVPACPGTATSYIPIVTPTPAPTYGNSTIPCPTETAVPPPAPVCPGDEHCPPPACEDDDSCPPPPAPEPVCPGGPDHCPPQGTGAPVPPQNTSVPVVPAPPPFESGANVLGASFFALAGAAVFAMLA